MIYNHSFEIHCERRPTFHDVTGEVKSFVESLKIEKALVTVYSQHTTCSVLIQEQSDDTDFYGEQFLMQDMVRVLEKIVPTCTTNGQYLHPGPLHIEIAGRERSEEAWWSLNTDAHLRSVLLGRSVCVPIENGEMLLGEFGVIYFADFDQVRARTRTVRVCVTS
ncbi:MAG: secondary thiamine-phosphate synthase enzyme YjbQ [Oscillospiraceae bacterium]|nr:secondary thiamine-phosphate synthase enzyme YjbQ [Oscillospiraceae bacterium]